MLASNKTLVWLCKLGLVLGFARFIIVVLLDSNYGTRIAYVMNIWMNLLGGGGLAFGQVSAFGWTRTFGFPKSIMPKYVRNVWIFLIGAYIFECTYT